MVLQAIQLKIMEMGLCEFTFDYKEKGHYLLFFSSPPHTTELERFDGDGSVCVVKSNEWNFAVRP